MPTEPTTEQIVTKEEVEKALQYYRVNPSSFAGRICSTLQQAMTLLEEECECGDMRYPCNHCQRKAALLKRWKGE